MTRSVHVSPIVRHSVGHCLRFLNGCCLRFRSGLKLSPHVHRLKHLPGLSRAHKPPGGVRSIAGNSNGHIIKARAVSCHHITLSVIGATTVYRKAFPQYKPEEEFA